ncbi:MAG: hypothetical protein ACK5AZ_09790 [Bryobacteraceae bacterium]
MGTRAGVTDPDPDPDLKSHLFSRTISASPHPNLHLVREDAPGAVARLKASPSATFTSAAEPIGQGLPLFTNLDQPLELELTARKHYDSGVLPLTYRLRYDRPL